MGIYGGGGEQEFSRVSRTSRRRSLFGEKSRSKTYHQTSEHTSIVNHAACTVISFYFVAPPPAAFTGCLCRVHITIFCSRGPGAARLVTVGSPFLTYR